jgi:hypothetical protein
MEVRINKRHQRAYGAHGITDETSEVGAPTVHYTIKLGRPFLVLPNAVLHPSYPPPTCRTENNKTEIPYQS